MRRKRTRSFKPGQTVAVSAPPGKLGLVVANPRRDAPVVLQTKEDSVLRDEARVGDLLLLADGVDCRGMAAADVSGRVARRGGEARTRVLRRER